MRQTSGVKAIRIQTFGGPEVMEVVELPDPEAGENETVVEVARAGINFADTHATRNDYLAEQTLPLIPGGEISGRTPDGRRVAALLANGGLRADASSSPTPWLIPLPDEVSDDQAAALLLQGLTAHALVHRCARLQPGETIVVQAAAGGTGTLAVQLAKRAGGRVIALASTRGEARAGDAAGRRRDRRLPRRGPGGGDPRGERGRPGRRRARDERRRRVRGLPADAGAVRAPGHLRDRVARAQRGRRPAICCDTRAP